MRGETESASIRNPGEDNEPPSGQGRSERRSPPAVALTVAGFDPTCGAGLGADLKVFAAHGLYGVAAATALTVQSTVGVRRVEAAPAALLAETLACLAEDLPLSGIKIGMLATAGNVAVVADFLAAFKQKNLPIVLDPVLRSTSGHALLDAAGLDCLRERLLPLVTCITPNLEELYLLAGRPWPGAEHPPGHTEISAQATDLAQRFPALGIVATGGHLDQPDDYVVSPGSAAAWLRGEWVNTRATHGTGCAYSSALLCGLVAALPLLNAAQAAKRYVTEALRAARPIGRGGGSMHHLYEASASLRE